MDALRRYDHAARHAHAGARKQRLGNLLVDGEDRGRKAAVGVFQAHQVQHSLHRAVLAGGTVQRVEHHVGLRLGRSEEHTSELQSLMRTSYAAFCLKKQTQSPTLMSSTTSRTAYTDSRSRPSLI